MVGFEHDVKILPVHAVVGRDGVAQGGLKVPLLFEAFACREGVAVQHALRGLDHEIIPGVEPFDLVDAAEIDRRRRSNRVHRLAAPPSGLGSAVPGLSLYALWRFKPWRDDGGDGGRTAFVEKHSLQAEDGCPSSGGSDSVGRKQSSVVASALKDCSSNRGESGGPSRYPGLCYDEPACMP